MQVPPDKSLEFLQQAPKSGAVEQLVVLLHGYGRDASLMRKLADEVQTRLPQALILMPQAPEEYEAHTSDEGNALRVPEQLRGDDPEGLSAGARRQWFSIRAASIDDMAHHLIGAAARVNDFISGKLAEYGLQNSDVALMGFSQGGVVALYAAYHRAEPVRCVVGHSTIFMGGAGLGSKPPTLYLYGLDDEEFKPARYEAAASFVKAHVPETTVRAVPGLRHTTNAESRAIVADYIAGYFAQLSS